MWYLNIYQLLLYTQKEDRQGALTVKIWLLLIREQTLLIIDTYLSRRSGEKFLLKWKK